MITEKELTEAIKKYENTDDPNAQTCITLAAFYTVRNELYPKDTVMSYDPPQYESETEFWNLASAKNSHELLEIMDELMTTLSVLHPKLYESVLRKLSE